VATAVDAFGGIDAAAQALRLFRYTRDGVSKDDVVHTLIGMSDIELSRLCTPVPALKRSVLSLSRSLARSALQSSPYNVSPPGSSVLYSPFR
jgi:hypothetical protein